MSYDASNKVA